MMRRLLPVLVILVGCALFWFWRASVKPLPPAVLSEVAPAPAAAGREVAQSPKGRIQDPAQRTSADLPAGVAEAKPVDAIPIDDRAPGVVDDPAFTALYAGLPTAKLQARMEELEPLYQAEFDRLCELRFASGLYRVVESADMEGIDPSYDVLAQFDEQGVLTRARAVAGRPAPGAPPEDGESELRMEYQIVSLPPEVYPDLYRQKAELDWLRATIAARKESGEDPP
ncbi:MAG TPA: hypothetical protein VK843_22810 [Planctomycetota bacterium]|nr:hypothetical protein [Planctomycetota bacterium]